MSALWFQSVRRLLYTVGSRPIDYISPRRFVGHRAHRHSKDSARRRASRSSNLKLAQIYDVEAEPHEFVAVPLSQVDTRAELQLESFLRRQLNEEHGSQTAAPAASGLFKIQNIPRSTLKRATLEFQVGGRNVRAIGESKRTKRARALCCMHAVRLIDHFSLDGSTNEAAPLPLTDELTLPRQNEVSEGRNGRNFASSSQVPSPPHEDNPNSWIQYVRECEQYIQQKQSQQRNESYSQLCVPPSGNPLVDRAAATVQQEKCADHLALQKLNNVIRDATKAISIVRTPQRTFVATLLLDSATQTSATGVARNLKEAKQRCAMHALRILDLIKEQRGLGSNLGTCATAGSGSCTSTDVVSMGLAPRYAKLFEFFTLLCGATFDLNFVKRNARYTCELKAGNFECTGHGINRFEAERTAIESALSEMELYDERLQAINSLIVRHPRLRPRCIPTAKLPEELREHIRTLVQRSTAGLELHGDAVSVSGEENDTLEGLVDRETRSTIRALEEAACDETYARQMRNQLCALRADPRYLELYHGRRSSLAITSVMPHILAGLGRNRVIVVCGTTGCGKTTQVPQHILDSEIMAGRGDSCCVLVTQPRRLTAFSVAERIASERLTEVGGDVGYAVRLDARPGRHITLCTTGVLLQMLAGMPSLDAVSHLVIDEVHERDINCDVLLALVKDLLESGRNPRLKVVLMSATMQSDMFSRYFDKAPVVKVDGAAYPVEVRYLNDIANFMHNHPWARGTAYGSTMFRYLETEIGRNRCGATDGAAGFKSDTSLLGRPPKTDYGLVAQLISISVAVDLKNDAVGKSILVFLPGWKELVATKQAVENLPEGQRYHIILLHSSVDGAKQRECFAPAPLGKVKVVLATNIAESGITIDDAAVVIDTGLIKQSAWVSNHCSGRYGVEHQAKDSWTSSSTAYATQLSLQYASRANCTQRKGRAGRTQGGVCYRLFPREVWSVLPLHQEAEIHRVPLTQVLLKLLALGHSKPKDKLKTFIEPPAEQNVESSMRQLQSLGAVAADERLTPLGLYLSRLPCEPTVAKMIMMGAVLRCLDSTLTMAATGDISPFISNREVTFEVRQKRHALAMESQSDHISMLNAYNAFCACRGDVCFARENLLSVTNMKLISRYKQQYRDVLRRSGFIGDGDSIPPAPSEGVAESAGMAPVLYVDTGRLSEDSMDVTLVKACLCAALFPNVAVVDPYPLIQEQSGVKKKQLVMRTSTHEAISPSKDSACRRAGPPRAHGTLTSQELFNTAENAVTTPSMLYIYQGVFSLKESREHFLTQVTSVSLWALLLFGVGEADMKFDRLLSLCIVGDWIGIRMDAESYDALVALRAALHACVWRKYKQPDDPINNQTLEELRCICKTILKSPPNDKEQHMNTLIDTGSILSPESTPRYLSMDPNCGNGNFGGEGVGDSWGILEI
ncbi:Double stranded RNA binding motifDEAD DEAH box helicase Helicase conserved C terminal domain [Trypanosoma vivax]|nr:Double stranded RNA binding motifDEAD DEAH box helicase Helicase conserved C terminal domain [Trypanosoma vivax]